MEFMSSILRLYGHPELLRMASEINGADLTPVTELVEFQPEGVRLPRP